MNDILSWILPTNSNFMVEVNSVVLPQISMNKYFETGSVNNFQSESRLELMTLILMLLYKTTR